MIWVDKISKKYKKEEVLHDVTFSVPTGRTACIIGQNGSGKSTLISILSGILSPSGGEFYFGSPQAPLPKNAIGYVPQQDQLFHTLSVRDNIAFWASVAGLSIKEESVQKSIALFGLTDFMHKKVAILSGGMRRRVALCADLLHNPQYILLDEPFTGLDLYHKSEICQYLNSLREEGKTILYTAHNIDEIHLMAQDLFLMLEGVLYSIPLPPTLDELQHMMLHYYKGE